MSKLRSPKLGLTFDEFQKTSLTIDDCNWQLTRDRDGLTRHSFAKEWIEWNEDGTYKESHEDVALGLSLVMSPFNHYYTWMTTTVTEIVEDTEERIKFKTENSNYELKRINNG